jgi:hypothetical protein
MPTQVMMLVAQYTGTDCPYAFVLVFCRHFQRYNCGHDSRGDAASALAACWCTANLDWLNIGQLQKSL